MARRHIPEPTLIWHEGYYVQVADAACMGRTCLDPRDPGIAEATALSVYAKSLRAALPRPGVDADEHRGPYRLCGGWCTGCPVMSYDGGLAVERMQIDASRQPPPTTRDNERLLDYLGATARTGERHLSKADPVSPAPLLDKLDWLDDV